MQKSVQELKPGDIIEIIVRHRWWIIVTFCISMIVGICLVFMLPRSYSAKTVILIQPQKVPANYVQSVVSMDVNSRLYILSQQILSRSNLEKIIRDFNLFAGPEYEKMFIEDKISDLRGRISIEPVLPDDTRDTRRNQQSNEDAFSISFQDKDPEKVLKVTNALTSHIINANLEARETEAIGTSDFLKEELDSIRIELAEKEKKLKEYREKYMGGLPEQLNSNFKMLDRLQEQLSTKQASLRDAKNRLVILESQISEGAILLNQGSEEPLTLEEAKARLAYLETRYTEKHPDIIRLRKMISDIEKNDGKNNQGTSDKSQYIPINLRIQTEQIKAEIKAYTADIYNLISQIRVYQKQVESTPKREQELSSLERDYNNITKSYNELLARKLEAEISLNMEKKQKGEKFQILDPARLPEKPSFPNMKILFILTLAAGLNIGFGLVFLLEYLNTSFRSPKDVESYLGLSVLATIPLIYDQKYKRRQKMNQIFSYFSIMFSFILLIVFAVLSLKGVEQTLALLDSFVNPI